MSVCRFEPAPITKRSSCITAASGLFNKMRIAPSSDLTTFLVSKCLTGTIETFIIELSDSQMSASEDLFLKPVYLSMMVLLFCCISKISSLLGCWCFFFFRVGFLSRFCWFICGFAGSTVVVGLTCEYYRVSISVYGCVFFNVLSS